MRTPSPVIWPVVLFGNTASTFDEVFGPDRRLSDAVVCTMSPLTNPPGGRMGGWVAVDAGVVGTMVTDEGMLVGVGAATRVR